MAFRTFNPDQYKHEVYSQIADFTLQHLAEPYPFPQIGMLVADSGAHSGPVLPKVFEHIEFLRSDPIPVRANFMPLAGVH